MKKVIYSTIALFFIAIFIFCIYLYRYSVFVDFQNNKDSMSEIYLSDIKFSVYDTLLIKSRPYIPNTTNPENKYTYVYSDSGDGYFLFKKNYILLTVSRIDIVETPSFDLNGVIVNNPINSFNIENRSKYNASGVFKDEEYNGYLITLMDDDGICYGLFAGMPTKALNSTQKDILSSITNTFSFNISIK